MLAVAGHFRGFVAQPENLANTADSRTVVGDLAGISKESCGVAPLRNTDTNTATNATTTTRADGVVGARTPAAF
jgi:hypothetical protein